MDTRLLAQELLEALGQTDNITSLSVCMTRLRVNVSDASAVNRAALSDIHGVLGFIQKEGRLFEVVFGPSVVEDVYLELTRICGLNPEPLRVLVINGPNINMLGIREPELYGTANYKALLKLCHDAAQEAGFEECSCMQSNHEGDLIDAIQNAYGSYAGIVINPGGYTHTSVALLDALKAVQLPTVEVHITDVDEREEFRRVSYVRLACFETISGMGIEGYRKAILDLAAYVREM